MSTSDIPALSTLDPAAELTAGIHHVGVQTADLEASIEWYSAYFGCTVNWTVDAFSPLSLHRLPGLASMAELSVGGVRFHLLTRALDARGPAPGEMNQFQHVCFAASSRESLRAWRERWFTVRDSGRFTFVRNEPASYIDVDDEGMESFYFHDINGLEFEFSYFPGGADAAA